MATSSTRFLHEISAVHRWLSRRLTCLLKNSGWKTILSFLKWLLSFGGHSFVFGVGNVSLPQQDRLLSLSKPWWPTFGGIEVFRKETYKSNPFPSWGLFSGFVFGFYKVDKETPSMTVLFWTCPCRFRLALICCFSMIMEQRWRFQACSNWHVLH